VLRHDTRTHLQVLEELRAGGVDAAVASGGGRMYITMDRCARPVRPFFPVTLSTVLHAPRVSLSVQLRGGLAHGAARLAGTRSGQGRAHLHGVRHSTLSVCLCSSPHTKLTMRALSVLTLSPVTAVTELRKVGPVSLFAISRIPH